jgi:hypothetical protein
MNVDKFGRHSTKGAMTKLLRGPPGQGFTLTKDGDFNIENKRLTNVAEPKEEADAATIKFVKNEGNNLGRRVLISLSNMEVKIRNMEKTLFNFEERIKKIETKINI